MITCPWCGTSYASFQSNCDRCGGPLSAPAEPVGSLAEQAPQGTTLTPPPPPRPIADSYVWRLVSSDGWAVVGFIFALLGAIFTMVGAALTLGIITAIVGIPFLALGLLLLGAGSALALARFQAAQRTVGVLRVGEAAAGQISSVDENIRVRVNNRHPWMITYRFPVNGHEYSGRVSTLTVPGAALQPGKPAYVLYLPQAPEINSLYPHP